MKPYGETDVAVIIPLTVPCETTGMRPPRPMYTVPVPMTVPLPEAVPQPVILLGRTIVVTLWKEDDVTEAEAVITIRVES